MSKRVVIIIAGILLAGNYLHSQHKATDNYVLNSGFEIMVQNPMGYTVNGNIADAEDWFPVRATPDFFHADYPLHAPNYSGVPRNFGGYQNAHSGKGYAGIVLYADYSGLPIREYIKTRLVDTLIANIPYFVEFYVNMADSSDYAVDGIGVYFSKVDIPKANHGDLLPFNTQVNNIKGNIITDTSNWTKISGSFIASGGEQYLILGNFKHDSATKISFVGGGGA